MQFARAKGGFLGLVILFLFVGGLIGLYFGYQWYNHRYYIKLYDGSMTRYLDVPPFAERLSTADQELIGECTLAIGTSDEQASQFYNSMSNRLGYLFGAKDKGWTIEVRRNYIVSGEFNSGKLNLKWEPVLPDNLKKKAQALSPETPKNTTDK